MKEFHIIGFESEDKEPIPSKVDMWYFKPQRSWIVQLKDEEGNQIGDAVYVHYKKEALKQVDDWKKEFGLSE